MYLKRLDLQGFKGFASRTLFEFGPGITAVVGPNGSGKSNVAESIRWVLGEQSARNMRGRRLEDMIFSGSSQKAAVGLAEVSITLDNSETWLPIDYDEVVVSRRAHRSGESEYLINKSKVRLRDVLDLFLRAQVGQNSYAFMGQGLVEEVLLMRPEERRRLLEEAADVRLLRQRLDEARDRLAATRENLERVNLLTEEIEPRLRQLERQASRAAEHSLLARELADIQRELYRQLWTASQESLVAAQAGHDQRAAEARVSVEEAQSFEGGVSALALATEQREAELSTRRQGQRQLSDETHAVEQRVVLSRERNESRSRRKLEVTDELEALRNERSDLQRNLSSDKERSLALVGELAEAKSLVETRLQAMSDLEQEQAVVRGRLAGNEDLSRSDQRGLNEASASINRLEKEGVQSEGDDNRRIGQKTQLVQKLADLGVDFQRGIDRSRDLEADIREFEQERIGLAAMIETARANIREWENDELRVSGEIGQLQARHELLQRLQESAAGSDAAVSFLSGEDPDSETDAAFNAVSGLVGLVREVIRVPPGLERAIEAALADNLEALVFGQQKDALAALALLNDKEAGRAQIYPLDGVNSSPPLNLAREKGVVGVAARLVRYESRFRPLVDALLGRVIVVENLALAHQELRRGLGSVATMDGFLLRPNGSISGGLSKAAADSFSRQQELEEIPSLLNSLEGRRASLLQRVQMEHSALEGSMSALSKQEPALQRLREELSETQTMLVENRSQLILLRSEARVLRSEMPTGMLDSERQRLRQRLEEERDRFQADLNEAADSLARDQEALQVLVSRRSSAVDLVAEATAAHADMEGEARSLVRQVQQAGAGLERLESGIRSREEQFSQLESDLADHGNQAQEDSDKLAAIAPELERLNAEMAPAEEELAQLRGRERTMREQLTEARARQLDAERKLLEAEASVKLRGEEMEGLRDLMLGEGFQPAGESVVAARDQVISNAEQTSIPPVGGAADVGVDDLRGRVVEIRSRIRQIGPVNEQAEADHTESKERYEFLTSQVADLTGSEETLVSAIDELEGNIREQLNASFAVVDREFQRYFESFFAGGKASLVLTQPEDMTNTGLDINAQPPGKRVNSLAMLSGGERTLTALALLLALLQAHPSPICVLDEVDAALDETNVGRFVDALRELGKKTQFIIVTHNPRTIEAADSIYGVSMGADNTSRVLSVRLSEPE